MLPPQSKEEALAWDLYFGSLVSMSMHPGFHQEPNFERLAYIADVMLEQRRRRLPCPVGSQAESFSAQR